jgi:ssRNA-specific RNase YbeY (16S rRNA maturation enzyme)
MRQAELFTALKIEVLGKRYDLQHAFLSPAEMRKVTKRTKPRRKVGAPTKASGKGHVSNVLSFPLSKTSGEILICKQAAAPYTPAYLFIHGLLHLKGLKHGARMESAEQELLQRFSLHAKNRHRH